MMHKHKTPVCVDVYRLKNSHAFFAGQMTGVGLYRIYILRSCSRNNAAKQFEEHKVWFPRQYIIGALARLSNPASGDFQPMNINFGIIDPLKEKIKNKKERYSKVSKRALEEIEKIKMAYTDFFL